MPKKVVDEEVVKPVCTEGNVKDLEKRIEALEAFKKLHDLQCGVLVHPVDKYRRK